MLRVEVAFALPEKQRILPVDVTEGTTMWQAVCLSGIVDEFPQIDLETAKMGLFGKVVKSPEDHVLREGDRVEIYRPLVIDPKQARLNRAKKSA
ncbi:MAG: RnfH family protein [Gammaproteobacteria bacterium]|nr:MAG: RnfH family protein [Gammaproteobacteria bacterium]